MLRNVGRQRRSRRLRGEPADNKTRPTNVSVEAFLDSVPDTGKRADALALIDMMERATGGKPVMRGPSIIGFGSHNDRCESGR